MLLFFEEWDTLINWKKTDLINPGEANRLTVIVEGSHFTFFINNQYLTEITNDKIAKGATALAAELSNKTTTPFLNSITSNCARHKTKVITPILPSPTQAISLLTFREKQNPLSA